jgi:hypothetical protein
MSCNEVKVKIGMILVAVGFILEVYVIYRLMVGI